MISATVQPDTLEEKVIFWVILMTWAMWVIGALYFVAPLVGWTLVAISIARRHGLAGDDAPYPERLPAGCWVWIAGMGTMLVALLVGHLELGAAQTLKSFMGWTKGWALIALFVFIGATMKVRPAVIYRASNLLAMQTLVMAVIMFIAGTMHLPTMQYISPLVVLGGTGQDFFNVELYKIDTETLSARWNFFSPWAPAAGMIANVSLVFALYDRDPVRKAAGVLASVAVCYMSQSRLAILVAPVIGIVIIGLSNLTRPMVFSASTAASVAALPFFDILIRMLEDAQDRFKNARAASSRVRATLQSIARHRWWNEAPIWGHGTVERGPHLVEFMPIGTHHTWNGLLFVKGIVGFTALAAPMACSGVELMAKAQTDRAARAALGVLLVIFIYTFAENMETLIYLFWPGMVIIGIALKRRFVQPFHFFMGR